jgi:hypothetical protein
LSPITTSLVLSVDMGIVKNLKTLHRAKLVNYILEAIQENLLTLYFMQGGDEGSCISELETCTDFVQLQSVESMAGYTRSIPPASITVKKNMHV